MKNWNFPFDGCLRFVPKIFELITCTGAISNPVHNLSVVVHGVSE